MPLRPLFLFSERLVPVLDDDDRRRVIASDVLNDDEALDSFVYLSRCEGIIPALESSHAIAHARRIVPKMGKDKIVIVNLSGRGDKDVAEVRDLAAAGKANAL